MSRSALRFVIVLATMSIVGIVTTQVYWVRKAFDLRENQFYRDVNTALTNVALKVYEVNKTPSPSNNPVSQISGNYFVVALNSPVDAGLLEFLLVNEFEKRHVTAEFEYSIYDCMDKCMVGTTYISPKKTKVASTLPETPRLDADGYYFAVHFPLLQADLISQMGIWGFSSAVMLVVIFFFVYTLLVILRQKRLSEVQKDFINNMTHEFKTPIATIALSAEVLKQPDIIENPERLQLYTAIIEKENSRLRDQVERVLQIATLDQREASLKCDQVDMHQVIEEATKQVLSTLEWRAGQLVNDLKAKQFVVPGDPLHLGNIIRNLLDNAVKYSLEKPVVKVVTANRNGKLLISVSDKGMGISTEDQKRIFEQFYRVHTGNVHDVKGFGLGLYYVKRMVELHQGRVSVESRKGEGTTFTIELPLTA
ncbi:MAG: sensor histidine kinase [Cyclobacteriaceae bacterium]|nr:HAMP domain-containing histidine kinase [Flammeovirgaceae bacterium]